MKYLIMVLMMVGLANSYNSSRKFIASKCDSVVCIDYGWGKTYTVCFTQIVKKTLNPESGETTYVKSWLPLNYRAYFKVKDKWGFYKFDSVWTIDTAKFTYHSKISPYWYYCTTYTKYNKTYGEYDWKARSKNTIQVDGDSIGYPINGFMWNFERDVDSFTVQIDTLNMRYRSPSSLTELPKLSFNKMSKTIKTFDALGRPVHGDMRSLPQGIYFMWDGRSIRKHLNVR